MASSPRARLAVGSFWNVAGLGIQMFAGMLASIVAARALGAAQFGELGIARTTLTLVTILAGVNLGAAAARAIADLRAGDLERTGRVIGFFLNVSMIGSLVATLLCLALAKPIAAQLGHAGLAGPIALSAIAIVFIANGVVLIGALQGFESFRAAGYLTAFEGVLTGTGLAAGAWIAGVNGAIAGLVLAFVIGYVVKRYVVLEACRRRGIVVRYRGLSAERPLLWALVVPIVLQGLLVHAFEWLARLALARGPNGFAEAGIFAAANSWAASIALIPMQVNKPAMPILTNLLAARDTAGFRRLLRDTMFTTFGFALLAAVPLALLAPWIMRAYGPAFASGARVLQLIALASVVAAICWSLRSALLATGNIWKQTAQSVLWGITLMAVFLLTREHGAIALACAYIAAYIVAAAAQAVMTHFAMRATADAPPIPEPDPIEGV
jgi:O-antigen/teichoic acid export membrane protein